MSHFLKRSGYRTGWSRERFNGLTPVMYETIRLHYREANDSFARAVWGVGSWSDLFPERIPKIVTPMNPWQLWIVKQNAEYLVRKFKRFKSRWLFHEFNHTGNNFWRHLQYAIFWMIWIAAWVEKEAESPFFMNAPVGIVFLISIWIMVSDPAWSFSDQSPVQCSQLGISFL